jgi:hypothetical protein
LDDFRARRVILRRVGASLNNWKRVKKIISGPSDMLLWKIDRDQIAAVRSV